MGLKDDGDKPQRFAVQLRVGGSYSGQVATDPAVRVPGPECSNTDSVRTGSPVTGRALGEPLSFVDFGFCPICLAGPPLTREHLPPAAVGGAVLTRTCVDCNNGFGSIERSLASVIGGCPYSVRFMSDDVEGRRAGTVRITGPPEGDFVMWIDGTRSDRVIQEMFESGEVVVEITEVPPALFRAAVLKQAYLAACVLTREVPNCASAESIRAELMHVRGAPRPADVTLGSQAAGLTVLPALSHSADGLVYAAVATLADRRVFGLDLGAVGFVSWPFPDFAPRSSVTSCAKPTGELWSINPTPQIRT